MNPLLQRPGRNAGQSRVAKLPAIDTSGIAAALNSAKGQVIGKGLGSLEIAEIFNRVLSRFNISFESEFQQSGHPDLAQHSLTRAYTETDGFIGIGYEGEFYEQFEQMDDREWATFVQVVCTLVVHEMTHRNQIESVKNKYQEDVGADYKIDRALNTFVDDPNDKTNYLSNPHEIAAFARTIVQELRAVNYNDEQILNLIRSSAKMKDNAADSHMLWTYLDYFTQEDPIFRKLIQEIHKVVTNKLASHKTPPLADNTYPEGSNGWATIPERQQGTQSPVPLELMMPEEFGIESKTGSAVVVRPMTGQELYPLIRQDDRLLEETMYLRHSNLRSGNAIHLVAFDGDKIVGDVELQENPTDANQWWFMHITTRVGYKGQGIASAMLRASVDYVAKSGRAELKISSFSDDGEKRVKPALERLQALHPEVKITFSKHAKIKGSYKKANVMIGLPGPAREAVMKAAALAIPQEELGTDGYEDDPHITVKFGVEEDIEKLNWAVGEQQPFTVTLGKCHVFTASGSGGSPIVAEAHAPDLHLLHELVDSAIGNRKDDFSYSPHVTLGFVKPEFAKKYEGVDICSGITFGVNSVVLSRATGQRNGVPFGKTADDVHTRDNAKQIIQALKSIDVKLTISGSVSRKGVSDHDIDFHAMPGPNFRFADFNRAVESLGLEFMGNEWNVFRNKKPNAGYDLFQYRRGLDKPEEKGMKVDFFFLRNSVAEQDFLSRTSSGIYEEDYVETNLGAVGPKKPVGYLPLSTISQSGFDPDAVEQQFRSEGKGTYKGGYKTVGSGGLWVYDRAALASLLNKHQETLTKAGWSSDPDEFVHLVAEKLISEQHMPELYRVIGLAFNDFRYHEAGPVSRALLPAALMMGLGVPPATPKTTPIAPVRTEQRAPQTDPMDAMVKAIARAEGARPERHNPGNIADFNTGKIKTFNSDAEGMAALKEQLRKIEQGNHPYIDPDMPLRQAGLIYSNGDPNWAHNVASIMGVSQNTPIGHLIRGEYKARGHHAAARDRWQYGGCWRLAYQLQQLLPGSKYVAVGPTEEIMKTFGVDHVAVQDANGTIWDSKGAMTPEQFLRRAGIKPTEKDWVIREVSAREVQAHQLPGYAWADKNFYDAAEVAEKIVRTRRPAKVIETTASVKTAFKIEVPKASREHFWDEPPEGNHEFWAFKHPVIVLTGEKIVFTFDGMPVAEAIALRTEGPGTTECQQSGRFKDHHKVFWDPKQFRSL